MSRALAATLGAAFIASRFLIVLALHGHESREVFAVAFVFACVDVGATISWFMREVGVWRAERARVIETADYPLVRNMDWEFDESPIDAKSIEWNYWQIQLSNLDTYRDR